MKKKKKKKSRNFKGNSQLMKTKKIWSAQQILKMNLQSTY